MALPPLPRITPTGVAVAAGGAALAIVGLALGYVVLIVIAVGVGVALLVGLVLAAGVPRLEIRETVEPNRVERGQPAAALLSARNTGRRRSRPGAAVVTIDGESVRRPLRSLGPGRSVVVRFPLPTERRGAVPIGPLRLIRSDPLGLWVTRRVVGDGMTLFVQPRIHPIDARPGGRVRHVDGAMTRGAPRGSLVFQSLREYELGDDVRRIHWRSSARTGTLMVREHVDTSLPSSVVVLDTRRTAYRIDDGGRQRFEAAVDVAASILAAAQREGHPVRLLTTDGTSLVARVGHRGRALSDYLADVDPVDEGNLDKVAGELDRTSARDSISIVGGSLDEAELPVVTNLASRFGNATLITIRSAADQRQRWSGGLHLDGETAEAALLHWHTASISRTPQRTSATNAKVGS